MDDNDAFSNLPGYDPRDLPYDTKIRLTRTYVQDLLKM